MDLEDEILQSQEFGALFTANEGDQVITWDNDRSAVGASLLRDYPTNTSFIPAIKNNGAVDSVVLTKVGFLKRNIKGDEVVLEATVSKASKFLLGDYLGYVFDNPDSPSADSLEKSNNSPQPINLTEPDRYVFNLRSKAIFDKKLRKTVTLTEVLNRLYRIHVDTASKKPYALILRLKIYLTKLVVPKIGSLIRAVEWISKEYFYQSVNESASFGTGFYSPVSLKDLSKKLKTHNPFTRAPSQTTIPGSTFPVSKAAVFLGSISLLVLLYLNFIFGMNAYHLKEFIVHLKNFYPGLLILLAITFFGLADFIIVSLLKIFSFLTRPLHRESSTDFVFEFFILPLWNFLIRLQWKLESAKFKYNPK